MQPSGSPTGQPTNRPSSRPTKKPTPAPTWSPTIPANCYLGTPGPNSCQSVTGCGIISCDDGDPNTFDEYCQEGTTGCGGGTICYSGSGTTCTNNAACTGVTCNDGTTTTYNDVCGGNTCAGTACQSSASGTCGHADCTGSCNDGTSTTYNDVCTGTTCAGTACQSSPGGTCGDAGCTGSCNDDTSNTYNDVCTGTTCAGTACTLTDNDSCGSSECADLACTDSASASGTCDANGDCIALRRRLLDSDEENYRGVEDDREEDVASPDTTNINTDTSNGGRRLLDSEEEDYRGGGGVEESASQETAGSDTGTNNGFTFEYVEYAGQRRKLGSRPQDDYSWFLAEGHYDLAIGKVLLSPSSMFYGGWTEGNWVNYNDTGDKTAYPTGFLTLVRSNEKNGSELNPYHSVLLAGTQVSVKIYRSNAIGAHCGFPDSDSLDSYLGTGYKYPFQGRNPNMDPFLITSNYSMGPGNYDFDVRAWYGDGYNHWKDKRLDNVTRVVESHNAVGPGCGNQGSCNGHGVCDYCGAVCKCFEGYGKFTDLTNVGKNIATNCSQRICPTGRAIMDVATGPTIAHAEAECSNAGECNRNTGECKCFEPWEGSSCNRMKCPNDCSGHGKCLSIRAQTRLANIVGSTHEDGVYRDQDLEYGARFEDGENNPSTAFTSDSYSWDRDAMRSCVCDSSWKVGLERGQTQLSEWFGPDCSQRRCPSGDDPFTTLDERRCNGQNQLSDVHPEKGHIGNFCHIDCSNRGNCNFDTGQCTCYEGFYGLNCGQTSRAGVHSHPETIPPEFWDYDNNTIGQLIY